MDSRVRERLIREITADILRRVQAAEPLKGTCECRTDCLTKCPSSLRQLVDCGAERFGIEFGGVPVSSDLAKYIDHTLLKPEATEPQVRQLCKEAAQYRFATVCVNPTWVRLCAQILAGTGV